MDELARQVALARGGDPAAFAWLVGSVRARALALARALVRDRQRAEDAVQEACLLAWRELPRLERPAAFAGWLLAIVRTSALKQARRRRPDLLEDLDRPAGPAAGRGPEEVAASAELRALVREAVRGLPARELAAVERFYLEGRSVEETAARLGIPAGTVKRQLFEARARLRARLAGLAPEAPGERPRARPLRRPL